MNRAFRLALTAALLLPLAGCVTEPPPAPAPARRGSPDQALNAVLAVAGADDREVAIQPVRDPQVEDLRQASLDAQRRGDWKASADALNQALLITPDDPAVLQERAEVAWPWANGSGPRRLRARRWHWARGPGRCAAATGPPSSSRSWPGAKTATPSRPTRRSPAAPWPGSTGCEPGRAGQATAGPTGAGLVRLGAAGNRA